MKKARRKASFRMGQAILFRRRKPVAPMIATAQIRCWAAFYDDLAANHALSATIWLFLPLN